MLQTEEQTERRSDFLFDVIVSVKSELGLDSRMPTEQLNTLNNKELRRVLKMLLTVGDVDLSSSCCDQVSWFSFLIFRNPLNCFLVCLLGIFCFNFFVYFK
jgi:hypothetical protein